jgi:hypothetical protein
VLFFVARVFLMFPVIPAMHAGEDYYHGRKQWAKEIASTAADRPVLMTNNLREASLYSFYSGKQGVALYTRPGKKSQYELWGYEDRLQGKEVFFLTKNPFKESTPLANSLQQHLHYAVLPSFTSYYHNISITATITRQKDSIEANLEIVNHRSTPLEFPKGLLGETTTLIFSIEKGKKPVKVEFLEHLSETVPTYGSLKKKVKFSIGDLPSGEYNLYFGIRNGVLPDAILSGSNQFQQ